MKATQDGRLSDAKMTQLNVDIDKTEWIALTSNTEGIGYFKGRLVYRDAERIKHISAKSSLPIVRRLYEDDLLGGCIDFGAVNRWLRTLERSMKN